jgi:hypothetical protein
MLVMDRKSKVKEGQIGIVRADKLQITADDDAPEKLASNLHTIMQAIPNIVIAGISTVRRAVIQSSQRKDSSVGETIHASVSLLVPVCQQVIAEVPGSPDTCLACRSSIHRAIFVLLRAFLWSSVQWFVVCVRFLQTKR